MNVCVIGAGIFGIAAAVELQSRGHSVTVVEKGGVPNENASSTDVSKAIRRWFYGNNETYVEMVERAAAQWRSWEGRFRSKIYHQTGGFKVVSDFTPGTPMYQSVEYLKGRGSEVRVLSHKETRERFPQFVIQKDEICLYEPWNGYLESGRAVSFLADLAREEGVKIYENVPVLRVEEHGSGIKIYTNADNYTFDLTVAAPGAWMGQLFPEVGANLEITNQQMIFIRVEDKSIVAHGAMPCWSISPRNEFWYGFPLLREGYVKVANDQLGERVDPDIDRSLKPEFVDWAMDFLRYRIPVLGNGKVVGGRACLYANSPDDNFIIDWVPGTQRILVAGGGSSHGFKFGAAIGPIIADALEEKPNTLGDQFRIGNRLNLSLKSRQKGNIPGFAY